MIHRPRRQLGQQNLSMFSNHVGTAPWTGPGTRCFRLARGTNGSGVEPVSWTPEHARRAPFEAGSARYAVWLSALKPRYSCANSKPGVCGYSGSFFTPLESAAVEALLPSRDVARSYDGSHRHPAGRHYCARSIFPRSAPPDHSAGCTWVVGTGANSLSAIIISCQW